MPHHTYGTSLYSRTQQLAEPLRSSWCATPFDPFGFASRSARSSAASSREAPSARSAGWEGVSGGRAAGPAEPTATAGV